MADFFKVDGLGAVKHTEETKQKLDALNGNQSDYIREAILRYAIGKGFNWDKENKPDYVSVKEWERYLDKQKTSDKDGRSNRVDYTYLIAHAYLQHKIFRDLPSSVIQRWSILDAPIDLLLA